MLRDWGGLGKTLPKSISSTADTYLERFGIRVAVVAVVLYRMANEDEQELYSSEDYSLPGDNQGSADSDKLKYRVILPIMVSGGPKTEEHYPGEKVSLMVSHVTDVNTTVFAGDVNAEFKQMVGGMGMYEFIMPNHDVVVDIKYSDGMVSPQNIADVPMMSMGGAFGGMGMSDKNKKLIQILPTGIIFMIVEAALAFGACRLQMVDKILVGSEGFDYMHATFYNYNPVTYALGHILFIGLGTLIYFQIFAKEMRRILELSLVFIFIEAIICILSAGGIFMMLAYQIVEKGKNLYIGGSGGSYTIGPAIMCYFSIIGWTVFPVLLMTTDIIAWSAVGKKVGRKKQTSI